MTADDYAAWIVNNADKKGTPEFDTVAHAYQLAKAQETPAPADATSTPEAFTIAAGQGLDKLAAGLRQATPEPVRNGLDWLNDKLGMGSVPSIDPMTQAANNAAVRPVQSAHPIASALGESAPEMAGGPLGMVGLAGLSYGTPMERAKNAAGAAIGAGLGAGVGKVAARVMQPLSAPISDAAQRVSGLFDQYGIKPLPSQATGSPVLAWVESVLSKLPGGSPLRAVAGDQQNALNTATMNAMGGSGDMVTPEAVNAAKQVVGKQFETIPAGQTVALDDTLKGQLADLQARYAKRLSADQKQVVGSYLQDIDQAGNSIPGDVYQQWRSDIAQRAASTSDSATKSVLTGIYKALDSAFNRSATGTAVDDYAKARAQYSVNKTVGNLANVTGDVSPARLATAAKNLPGAGGDLASLGQAMKSLPDSATAQRLFYQSLLSGGVGAGAGLATGDPSKAAEFGASSFALPYLLSKGLASDAGRKYLTQGLLSLSPEIERKLVQASALGGGLLGLNAAQ